VAPAPPPAPPAETAAAPQPPPEPPKPSLSELIKQNLSASLAGFNAHDAKKHAELYTPDATLIAYGVAEIKGREAIADHASQFLTAFPDAKLAVSRVIEKGDTVITEWTLTGTNSGEFMGTKATNKAAGVVGASVFSFTPDGLVQKEQEYFDSGTLAAQLGLAKGAPSRPVAALPQGEPEFHVAKDTPDEQKNVDLVKPMYAAIEKKSEADFVGSAADNITWSDYAAPKDMVGKDRRRSF